MSRVQVGTEGCRRSNRRIELADGCFLRQATMPPQEAASSSVYLNYSHSCQRRQRFKTRANSPTRLHEEAIKFGRSGAKRAARRCVRFSNTAVRKAQNRPDSGGSGGPLRQQSASYRGMLGRDNCIIAHEWHLDCLCTSPPHFPEAGRGRNRLALESRKIMLEWPDVSLSRKFNAAFQHRTRPGLLRDVRRTLRFRCGCQEWPLRLS